MLSLLRDNGVECLIDVRRHPGSRRMPHFNAGVLARELEAGGIGYLHLEGLGGRRAALPGSPNGGWRVKQFQGYADHMDSDEFAAALAQLEAAARSRRVAVMCAEARWVQCHRRLLADKLVARGARVMHVGADGRLEEHELTPFAQLSGHRIEYPPSQGELGV